MAAASPCSSGPAPRFQVEGQPECLAVRARLIEEALRVEVATVPHEDHAEAQAGLAAGLAGNSPLHPGHWLTVTSSTLARARRRLRAELLMEGGTGLAGPRWWGATRQPARRLWGRHAAHIWPGLSGHPPRRGCDAKADEDADGHDDHDDHGRDQGPLERQLLLPIAGTTELWRGERQHRAGAARGESPRCVTSRAPRPPRRRLRAKVSPRRCPRRRRHEGSRGPGSGSTGYP
jgi:hypothetical protein